MNVKMLSKPAGGQGRCCLAKKVAFSRCAATGAHVCTLRLLGVHALFPGRSVGLPHPPSPEHPSHRKSPEDRLKWETCPLHQTQIPNPAAVTTCSGTLGKSLSLYPSGRPGGLDPKAPGVSKLDPL